MGPKLIKRIGRLIIHGQLNRLKLASAAPFGTFIPDDCGDPWGDRGSAREESDVPGTVRILLSVCNPEAPSNVVQYDYLDGVYVFIPTNHTIELLDQEPTIILKDALRNVPDVPEAGGEEEKIEAKVEEPGTHSEPPQIIQPSTEIDSDDETLPESDGFPSNQTQEEDDGAETDQLKPGMNADDNVDSESESADTGGGGINLFSHCERGTQTAICRMKNVSCTTFTSSLSSFSAVANGYEMHIAYETERNKRKGLDTSVLPAFREEGRLEPDTDPVPSIHPVAQIDTIDEGFDVVTTSANKPAISAEAFTKLKSSAKIIERMLSQGMYDEYGQDLKYFEDASDDHRDNEGTLLPLWRFAVPVDVVRGTKESPPGVCVTSVAWNKKYADLVAVGFGSDEHDFEGTGIVCFYSLKNAFYPEKTYKTPSPVTSLAFHDVRPYLLAVAIEDGSVYVYSIHRKMPGLLYGSLGLMRKQTSIITQVRWIPDKIPSCPTFVTVSAAGEVDLWLIHNKKLVQLLVSQLPFLGELPEEVEESGFRASCTCISTHPTDPNSALIGTEEGLIFSMNLESDVLPSKVFHAHHLPVSNVRWNPFHPDIFLSGSADATVKIWDDLQSDPLFLYELPDPVTDIAWAPFSSTIFGAITSAGKAYIYDLSVKKYEPICVQRVAPKERPKLTRMEFNEHQPLIVIGEESGFVGTYKLSPNLRKTTKVLEDDRRNEVEVAKLEKLRKLLKV